MQLRISKLEQTILIWLQKHAENEILSEQLREAQVISRDYTGAGVFLELCATVNSAACDVSLTGNPINGPNYKSPDIDLCDGGSLLFLDERGYINMLELHGFGGGYFGEWIDDFTITEESTDPLA